MEQDIVVLEYECVKALMRENVKKKWNQFFGICIEKYLTSCYSIDEPCLISALISQ